MNKGFILFGLVTLGLMLDWGTQSSQQALALSPYLDHIRATYQQPLQCNVCHQKQGFNAFGQDFRKVWQQTADLKKTFKMIESLDSDGDGFSNKQELKAGCAPADATVFPDEKTSHTPCLTRPQQVAPKTSK